MASAAFSGEFILPIRGRTIRPPTKSQTEAMILWRWRAIADAASGIAFLATLVWVIWHFGVQMSQMAATGMSSFF